MADSDHRTIVDIGLHRGDDAEFYLKKGFRVVGVEAHPALADACRRRFAAEIADGRLTVVHAALHGECGQVPFYANLDKDDWSSTDVHYGARDSTRHSVITVPAITFERLDAEYLRDASVYYIKCDIEGGDRHALEGLLRTPRRPRFFSVEAHDPTNFAYLYVAGYRRFKLVNQNLNWKTSLPNPAREGLYVQYEFGPHSSGPFGQETVGRWMPFDQAVDLFMALRHSWTLEPAISQAWYDIHAAQPE